MALLLDGLGIFYVTFAALYSLVFFSGCATVWSHRSLPTIRMRKPAQMLGALVLLHIYLVLCLLAYPINGRFPCVAEYWIMAVYLPSGIGLFQASNQRLLIISRKQIDLAKGFFPVMKRHTPYLRLLADLPGKWRTIVWRYDFWVYTFLIVQSFLSLIIFLASRKFHTFGVVSEHVDSSACRRGWEWVPTILWMFLWAYIFGPLLLWNIHMVRDIHRWQLQTVIAVIASVPGTPLWLAALYSERMAKINKLWVPQMWFVPGLITVEIVTLVFPLLQIYKRLRWARKFPTSGTQLGESTNASYTAISEPTTARTTNPSRGKLYTMKELEQCLLNEDDRQCLQDFACKREFTGENIMFLIQVHDFHSHWDPLCNADSDISMAAKFRMFRAAVTIFAHLICPDTASVYVNIEGRIYKALDAVLGDAARAHISAPTVSPLGEIIGDAAKTNDFGIARTAIPLAPVDGVSLNSSTGRSFAPITTHSSREGLVTPPEASSHLAAADFDVADIAEGFHPGVFDEAYESVKNMVYAQTWQRFNQEKNRGGVNNPTAV